MKEASYNKLYYNSVDIKINDNKLEVKPQFLCPICDGRPKEKIKQEFEDDFNGLLGFTLSCCNLTINLYVKVEDALGDSTVTISTIPIA